MKRAVLYLRARKETGDSVRKIAARFGVDPSTVQRISRPLNGASVAAWRFAVLHRDFKPGHPATWLRRLEIIAALAF